MESKRYRTSLLGCQLTVSVYRNCSMPGIDVELETPRATVGGYIHA